MERRDFFRGAAVTGLGVVGAGCSATLPEAGWSSGGLGEVGLLHPEVVKARWTSVERARAGIADGPPLVADSILRGKRSVGRTVRDDVARNAARALLLTGAFRDLPETARTHPMVQASMWKGMAELDQAMFGMKAELDAMSSTERADISRELRRDPELAERVVSLLDERASVLEVSDARRLHFRRLGLEVCHRLSQSSELLVGEYTAKLQKLAERHGTEAEIERKLAAAMGAKAFRAMQERSIAAAEAYRRYEVAGVQRVMSDADIQKAAEESGASTSSGAKTTVLTVGGVFMGLAATCGLVALITGLSGAGIVSIIVGGTAGGLFLLTGTILLIVGAVID